MTNILAPHTDGTGDTQGSALGPIVQAVPHAVPITPALRALFEALLAETIKSLEGWAPITGNSAVDVRRKQACEADIAREWITGSPAPLTFSDVCWGLGLDPDATRDRLLPRFRTKLNRCPTSAPHRRWKANPRAGAHLVTAAMDGSAVQNAVTAGDQCA